MIATKINAEVMPVETYQKRFKKSNEILNVECNDGSVCIFLYKNGFKNIVGMYIDIIQTYEENNTIKSKNL